MAKKYTQQERSIISSTIYNNMHLKTNQIKSMLLKEHNLITSRQNINYYQNQFKINSKTKNLNVFEECNKEFNVNKIKSDEVIIIENAINIFKKHSEELESLKGFLLKLKNQNMNEKLNLFLNQMNELANAVSDNLNIDYNIKISLNNNTIDIPFNADSFCRLEKFIEDEIKKNKELGIL